LYQTKEKQTKASGLTDLLSNPYGGSQHCLSRLKLCHQLMVTGGFKDCTETVFGRRCSKGFA